MPHSTQNSQTSASNYSSPDEPMSAQITHHQPPPHHHRTSASFGIAVTSSPSHDERARLPSQRDSNSHAHAWKRQSLPIADAYADLIGRGTIDDVLQLRKPGDRTSMRSLSYTVNNDASAVAPAAAKRASQYHEERAHQSRESVVASTADIRLRHSPVVAELKTNVIIKDEFTLVTDLSLHLAQRYSRADSCVMVKVDHSACLALGGTFDPCYILTVNAVPSQMTSSSNKRNAASIQQFMADILSVPAERGIMTFVPIPEENLATRGTTLQALDKQEKHQSSKDASAFQRAVADAANKSLAPPTKKHAIPALDTDLKTNGHLTATTSGSDLTRTPSTATPAGSATNLYELALSKSSNDGRPSTAHGRGAADAINGLRMNGVSTEQLNSRLPNGRPKTFSAQPTSVQEQIKSSKEPRPHVSRQSSHKSQRIVAALKPDRSSKVPAETQKSAPVTVHKQQISSPIAITTTSRGPTTTRSDRPIPATTTTTTTSEPRTRNTYLDNLSSLTKKSDAGTNVDQIDWRDDGAHRDSPANTARRRTTVTATPKMPPPPPVPESDSKSLRLGLGKRKSFLKAFSRRSLAT